MTAHRAICFGVVLAAAQFVDGLPAMAGTTNIYIGQAVVTASTGSCREEIVSDRYLMVVDQTAAAKGNPKFSLTRNGHSELFVKAAAAGKLTVTSIERALTGGPASVTYTGYSLNQLSSTAYRVGIVITFAPGCTQTLVAAIEQSPV